MKTINNKKYIFTLVVLFSIIQISFGQNYSDDEDETGNETSVTELNGEEVSPELFSTFFNTAVNPKLSTVQGNSVFITQVGESNRVAAAIFSNASEINVAQNGDLNDINLQYQVDKVVADISQNGNNNEVKDYVLDGNAEISLDLIQNGDNLKFDKFGSNSMTKNIKFTQTEASPTVIIRSFN